MQSRNWSAVKGIIFPGKKKLSEKKADSTVTSISINDSEGTGGNNACVTERLLPDKLHIYEQINKTIDCFPLLPTTANDIDFGILKQTLCREEDVLENDCIWKWQDLWEETLHEIDGKIDIN